MDACEKLVTKQRSEWAAKQREIYLEKQRKEQERQKAEAAKRKQNAENSGKGMKQKEDSSEKELRNVFGYPPNYNPSYFFVSPQYLT